MDLNEEYVTNALKSDAKRASTEYKSSGLSAYAPKRPTHAGPKPNTRFLRNIVRETDSHNAALLARERREAREKQRKRERSIRDRTDGRLSPPREYAQERPPKRRRSTERYDSRRERGGRGHESEEEERSRRKRKHRHAHHRRSWSSSRTSDSRKRERPTQSIRSGKEHLSDRYKSFPRSRSRSSEAPYRDRPDGRTHKDGVRLSPKSASPAKRFSKGSDSDPLEEILGPPPAPPEPKVRSRGRGALSANRAAMDEHFASSYDPKIDVQPDPETEDDWEQALEAMRDRQRWKQQGAERLKSAGFSDAEVKKWEKGDAKDEEDVRWSRRGEGREWDRGKVVGDDSVDLEPDWGRLKDT